MKLTAPKPAYSSPVASGSRGAVTQSIRAAATMGKGVETAMNQRRLKLSDALGKMRGK